MENIKLLHGDCLELMEDIQGKSIDMILCDLPYGQTARNKWDTVIPFETLWKAYKRIIKDNGAIILFANGMFTADLMQSNRKMWRYNLIWEKTQPTGFLNAKRMPLRAHEDICVFYKKPPVYNPQKTKEHKRKVSKAESKINCKQSTNYGEYKNFTYDSTERYPRSVLKYAKDIQKGALHPTQKPVKLLQFLIKTYTNPGEIILDNCMGSGSTGVACLHTGRRFIGMELDPEHYNTAVQRIEQEKQNIGMEVDGEYFSLEEMLAYSD